jgi:GrpB-like predicted nucleotidyltransferase (UPF0157 family)/predicted acetyltransferase
MILQTDRLILREFTDKDLEELSYLLGNEEIMRYSVSGPIKDKFFLETYLQDNILSHYKHYGYGLWAVVLKETQRIIGAVGLKTLTIEGKEETELGYRFHPDYWGKGFATEASLAVCRYSFSKLSLDYVIAIIDPRNVRSIHMAKRLGMRFIKDSIFFGISVRIYKLDKIKIVPHQAEWMNIYQIEKQKLLNVFKDFEIHFYHIGSTSIPGCVAKPIIDILGVTSDVTEIDSYNPYLSDLGFEALGEYGMKQRRYFRKQNHFPINLHIFEDTDPEVERHLRFCDYLRRHPEEREMYESLKQFLANESPENIDSYSLGKETFIKKIDHLAALEAKTFLHPKKSIPRKKHWTPDEIQHAMEVNMHLLMTQFAKYVPSLHLIFQNDTTIIQTDFHDDNFNYILASSFTNENVKERVSSILNIVNQSPYPFTWCVSETDTPANLEEVLRSQGLIFEEEDIGMYMELDRHLVPQSPTELRFEKVDSSKNLRDFAQIIREIWGHEESYEKIYKQLPQILYTEGAPFEMHVAYVDDVPAASGMLLLHANVAGVYYIATMPNQRRKGYAKAMMEHLLERATRISSSDLTSFKRRENSL